LTRLCPSFDTPFALGRKAGSVIDDFDAVPPPAEGDALADEDDRFRAAPPRDPEEDAEWRSEFRSYLDDPA
jgi:hypothetical protein